MSINFFLQFVLFVLIPMTLDFLRWTIIGPLPEILCSTSVWIKNVIFSNVCIINFAKVSFICTFFQPYFLHLPHSHQSTERTTDPWWLDPKFSTAQNHTPDPNRKSCKMYKNRSFLQKKMFSHAKSQTKDTQLDNIFIKVKKYARVAPQSQNKQSKS